ncbi:transferase [Aureococcus anophagefferens]|nr:transferase [Aureococcus anophagefferens]
MNALVLALALLAPASAKVVRLRGSTGTVVLALALLSPSSAKVVRLRGSTGTDEFAAWKAKYAKHYASPAAEQAARTAFLARSEAIAAHNAGGHTYEHVIPADFDRRGALDWVAKGAVTGVKNQGQCGSCWAFSTTGAMEGALFAATGSLLSLSEEQLVQCDSSSYGCNGGFPSGALSFVASNGGVCAESDYAYTSGSGQTGSCRRNACASVMTVEGSVAAQGEQAMLSALQQRPLSILIDAEDCNFQSYRGGIIDNYQCGSRQDHAVLLVGYGTENGVDYWKVKNSWASSWGENGYFRVVRNKNMLGLGSGATYAKGAPDGLRVDEVRVREQPASCDGYCGSAPTTKKYACANDQCVERASGAYADVASCEAACGSPGRRARRPGPDAVDVRLEGRHGLDGVNAFITTVADEAACCQMCHLSTECEAVSFVSGACYGFTAGFSLSAGLPGISAAVL